jgi:hypothetical protein
MSSYIPDNGTSMSEYKTETIIFTDDLIESLESFIAWLRDRLVLNEYSGEMEISTYIEHISIAYNDEPNDWSVFVTHRP